MWVIDQDGDFVNLESYDYIRVQEVETVPEKRDKKGNVTQASVVVHQIVAFDGAVEDVLFEGSAQSIQPKIAALRTALAPLRL